MLPKYNVFPKYNGEIGTGYLFHSKGRKKEERDNIAQASLTPSEANFLRFKNNLFGFILCPPDPMRWWHHAHKHSYSLVEPCPCGSTEQRSHPLRGAALILRPLLWTCVGSSSPDDRNHLWGPPSLFLKDNTCSQPSFIPSHFVSFSPSQHCFAGIIPTNFKVASAEMLIRYMVHTHTKTRINWLIKHTLGILFGACFLIFCRLDRLTFSKSLNSGPFLLNKSFFISLLSHFIISTFLSFHIYYEKEPSYSFNILL